MVFLLSLQLSLSPYVSSDNKIKSFFGKTKTTQRLAIKRRKTYLGNPGLIYVIICGMRSAQL